MNSVNIGDLRGRDDAISPQITVRATRTANADRLIGQLHMKRLNIGLGVNGEGLDTKLATGADDAKGDFTAVGDEDFLDHQKSGY